MVSIIKTKGQLVEELETLRQRVAELDKLEAKQTEEEIRRNYHIQGTLGQLLHLSLEVDSLEELLRRTINKLVSIPWLTLESRGAVFLVEDEPQQLVMKAHHGLPTSLLATCTRVPFGRCLCGRAALSAQIEFADCVDKRHENRYQGISPHGHYCVPIISAGKVLGVVNLYLKEGHQRNESEEDFLRAAADLLAGMIERKRAERQLRQSEEKLRLMFESVTEGITVSDLEGNIVDVNEAVVRMHGYDKKEEIIGWSSLELIAEKDRAKAMENLRKTLEEGSSRIIQYTLMRGDRSEFPAELDVAVVKDASGNATGFITITRDVTERRKMEQQLILTDRLASIGELASGIAHELNNPLTSVIGFSQLLLDRDLADDIKSDIEVVCSEAQRATAIVKNLLAFARRHPSAKEMVNIDSIIGKVLELRSYEQRVSNIQVNIQFDPDLPETMVDYFQLHQVFLNIIINAEYFMIEAHNKGILNITTERVGNIIKASFADDGPGISKENLEHLFDPFFTTKEVGKGTGLGLSICHGIVMGHGGRIYTESELGKGATFVVELPIINDREV